MIAVIAAAEHFRVSVRQIELFSIGTGEYVTNRNIGSTRFWTPFHWGLYLIEAMLKGASNEMHEYFVRHMALGAYTRIQFERHKSWRIDDPNVVAKAMSAWQDKIVDGAEQLKNF